MRTEEEKLFGGLKSALFCKNFNRYWKKNPETLFSF